MPYQALPPRMRILPLFLFCVTCLGYEVQNLPLLRLKVPGAIGDNPSACTAQLILPAGAGASDQTPRTATIKLRGATSRIYNKKSLSLKLKKDANWLGLRPEKEWILNAAFIDFSMMRHKLSYDLFRSFGNERAPRFAAASRFVEVTLNDEYYGVYLLMEPVKDSLLGLSPGDDKNPALLYKAVGNEARFEQPGHADFEQKMPDPDAQAFWGPLDDLNGFVSKASDKDFFDGRTGIGARLDIGNAIDFHLLVLVTSNIDGIIKNYLLARDAPSPRQPAPKFLFVPWDYDATFGRNWDGSRVGPDVWLSNRLFDRLMGNAFYRPLLIKRWQELRKNQLSEATLLRMIDENVRTLGPAAMLNQRRWRGIDGSNPADFTFAKDVAEMKAWVPQRLAWLDGELRRRTTP